MIRSFIAALLTVALTLVSFGHQSVSPKAQAQADAYILAGGSWSDLCGENGDPLAHSAKCMACLITAGCALPPPAATVHRTGLVIRVAWSVSADTSHVITAHAPQMARAPPFHLL